MESEHIFEKIEKLLKSLEITNEDFREKGTTGGQKRAHEKVVDALRGMWRDKYGFIEERAKMNIDFVGREKSHGKIIIAVEVDTGWNRPVNWLKLCDVRAANKAWIYVDSDMDWRGRNVVERRKVLFEKAINEIKSLLKSRAEEEKDFGGFSVYLKTPTITERVNIFSHL
jgi:hypothetical protein